jgi:hypothetical protein
MDSENSSFEDCSDSVSPTILELLAARDSPTRRRASESGDVLIERAELPEPRRGDLLAVPATGAYTLEMASNYNALPRPAVRVGSGQALLTRRRERVDDLLQLRTSE